MKTIVYEEWIELSELDEAAFAILHCFDVAALKEVAGSVPAHILADPKRPTSETSN